MAICKGWVKGAVGFGRLDIHHVDTCAEGAVYRIWAIVVMSSLSVGKVRDSRVWCLGFWMYGMGLLALILGQLGHDLRHIRRGTSLSRCLHWWSDSLALVGEKRSKRGELVAQLCEMRLGLGTEARCLRRARHLS